MKYELVMGLETHVELCTKTKIFCGCTTDFKGEQNTHCCPICIGLPGTMPKLNREVVRFAVMAGVSTNCNIAQNSKMDRKNYVYPDLPKAYQISQYDKPLCFDGYITLSSGKKIGIERIHIEEDAGKLIHEKGATFIDYNRAGVPLIEIVSKPDFRSVEEVLEYLELLQLTMRYIKVSDCRMQEGSLRCDVNVSVREVGAKEFGTRTEIKNMNSFTNIKKAVNFEKKRQIELLEAGKKVVQETMRFNVSDETTEPMRGKEDAHDYRYFKEPDLVNINIEEGFVEDIKNNLPELATKKFSRYVEEYEIPAIDAKLLVEYRAVAEFFEESVKNVKDKKSYKNCSNFIISLIFSKFETEAEKENFDIRLSAKDMSKILQMLEEKKIRNNIAKKALEDILVGGKSLDVIFEEDFEGISEEEVKSVVEMAVKENEKAVLDYKNGKEKAIKSLVGFVMRQTKGKADPIFAEKLLKEALENS